MSRTKRGAKAPGYEYWSRRPFNRYGATRPGKFAKKRTHKAERQNERISLISSSAVAHP